VTLIFAEQKKLKLNLNSRWVVIFVLRLVKPLSNQRFCSDDTGNRREQIHLHGTET